MNHVLGNPNFSNRYPIFLKPAWLITLGTIWQNITNYDVEYHRSYKGDSLFHSCVPTDNMYDVFTYYRNTMHGIIALTIKLKIEILLLVLDKTFGNREPE